MINIKAQHKFTLPLYNGGANQSNITLHKEQLLMQEIRKYTELINTNTHYPINNHISYDLSLDVVILTQKEYKKFLDLQITNPNLQIIKKNKYVEL